MKNKPLYSYTQYLILASIIFSIISYGKDKIFHTKEIYPFFWWQLFTNPVKGSTSFEMLRLYEIKGKDTIRLANDGKGIDDVAYTSLLTQAQEKINNNESHENINKYIRAIGIEKSQQSSQKFIFIKEIYKNPIKITSQHHEFDKEILFITTAE